MSVAMLEEGEWHEVDEITARPREMTELLYRDAGQVATVGQPADRAAARPGGGRHDAGQLRHVLPHPAAVLERWRDELGLRRAGRGRARARTSAASSAMLNVVQVHARAGRAQRRRRHAAASSGWAGRATSSHRNARGCVGSGVCAFGCPTAPSSTSASPTSRGAWEAGATTYTGARAQRMEVERGRARAVIAAGHRAAGRCTWRATRDRRLRGDPHPAASCAARASAARPASWAATWPSIRPPGCARSSTRRSRVAGRAPELLRRRVRRRGDHARGDGRAARLRRDGDARARRASTAS